VPSPTTPVPAEDTADELWDDSPLAALFAVLSLLAVGILAFGAGHVLASVVWRGDPAAIGVVRSALALLLGLVGGPPVIGLLSSAFRRLTEAWRHR